MISEHPPPVGYYDTDQGSISRSTKSFKISSISLDRTNIPKNEGASVDWYVYFFFTE